MTDSSSNLTNAIDCRAADARWTWTRGGTASVSAIDGDALTVCSTAAYPPGAPLTAVSDNRVTFEMKVRTCRKLASGEFELLGKLVNATRPLREQLAAAVVAKDAAHK